MRPSTTKRRRVLGFSGAAVASSLAGCSGVLSSTGHTEDGHSEDDHSEEGHSDHSDHRDGGLGEAVDAAEVTMVTEDGGTHFEPHVVRVKSGGSVTWKLGSGQHSATAYHPGNGTPARIPEGADSWDSGVLEEAGASFERSFEVEGVYDYFCTPHETTGMIGTVVVGSPGSAGQPGLEPPQEGLPSRAREKIRRLNERVSEGL